MIYFKINFHISNILRTFTSVKQYVKNKIKNIMKTTMNQKNETWFHPFQLFALIPITVIILAIIVLIRSGFTWHELFW